ncbi:unnamed protein product [Bemisia tabaci]|uniref:C2H2-type domain-containing protein n=2 Tax=Bemisia tabaci TaxID=7038 RepID=A0A9N9ZXI8_BEMTA|nr:unnamed protein product [Bemisia tabaci]
MFTLDGRPLHLPEPQPMQLAQSVRDRERVFPCKKCNKCYQNVGSLWRHERYECGKEPAYQCTLCGYKSAHKHNLKKHYMLRHNPDKPDFLHQIEY